MTQRASPRRCSERTRGAGLATELLQYGIRVEPCRSRTTQPSSIPQRSRCRATPTYPDGILACFTASDPDPLASAGSRCILDFGTHKEICKGETQEDMANHALHTLQSLVPARVCAFKSRYCHHHSSMLQSSAGGTSLYYVRSLSNPHDVRPPERVTFLTMWDFNW